MGTQTPPNEETPTINTPLHPIPSSIIIVNESTPLISQEQQLASGPVHRDTSFHLKQFLSLTAPASDPNARELEIRGLLLMILSSLLFTAVSAIVKFLTPTFPFFEIILARSIVQLLLGIIGCYWLNINPLGRRGVRKWILIRALVSSVGLCLFFYSLTKLTLLDATAIFFMGPVFKTIIGSILSNESFSALDGIYSIVCFIGLLFVSKPSFMFDNVLAADREEMKFGHSFAITCALAGAIMSAMAFITVAKVGRTHVLVHAVYFGWITSLISIPVFLFGWQTFVMPTYDTLYDIGPLSSIGVLAFFGQLLLNFGLKTAPSGPVTIARLSDIAFAFVFGLALFKEIPDMYSFAGSIIVTSMTTAMTMHHWHRQTLTNAAIRRRKSKDKLIQRQQQRLERQQS